MTFADRLKRATYLAALPAAAALTAVVVPMSAAHAQAPAATMTVLTPKQNETLGTNRFNLDVRFKSITNSPVVTAELWVDGVRWVRRDLDSPRRSSTLSFLVDGSTLSAGSHTIVVKVLNAEGNISSAKVSVVAGSNEASGEAAWGGPEVQFVSPGNGKKIAGAVEFLVDAKSRNGQNPYVTFYVDDKFKTLKNYPPYNFVWDTTTETNGVHTITASGYLDSSNVTTTRKITVYVNNPGGFTKRVSEIPDLSAPKVATPATKTVAKALTIPLPKTTETVLTAPKGEAVLAESTAKMPAMQSLGMAAGESVSAAVTVAPRLSAPKAPVLTATKSDRSEPVAPNVAVNAVPDANQEPTLTVSNGTAALEATRTFAKLSEVTFETPKASAVATPRLLSPTATIVAKPMRTASALPAAKPAASIAAPVKTLIIKPIAGSVAAPAPVPSKRLVKSLDKNPLRTDAVKPIQVAYDGERIAFDVAPRVEAGLPVAPFRQIFEHSGGKVSWANDTKTMRAVNSNREIVIGVGKKAAVVNGEKVSLDRAARLEKGRTIVPLNFVGKAMDVDVKYDEVTGRLTITSKN